MHIDPTLVLKTPGCDVLGLRYPVLQAGMAVAGNGTLAAAVADAGGLGTIGSIPGGMSSHLIDDIQPAGEIVRSAVREAVEAFRAAALYTGP